MEFDEIAATLRGYTYRYTSEDDLQAAVAGLLPDARREVRLGAHGIIDVVCGRTGIECKVDGSVAAVIRQLDRYAHGPELDALVLVTNRVRHRNVPPVLHGKPVAVVMAVAGW